MKTPPIPADETSRLASLSSLKVLDTPAEERFDRITRLAKALFTVPTALISLVDEKRQWFKSRQGLTASETPREISFCGHAILEDSVLWVADAREDKRFHDNPLVVGEPNIRFYAGYPLRDREGHRLGTLCVLDQQPRPSSPAERELLADLGRIAENELGSLQLGTNRMLLPECPPEERKERLDEVTGVWNREGMLEILRLGLASCAEKQWPATVILGQVADKSGLSETWTEQGSDILLSEVAQVLRGCIRDYDSIGRTGDDQFLMLLAGLAECDAEQRVTSLQHKIDENLLLQSIGVRMHFGFASVQREDHPADIDALLGAVSDALERSVQARQPRTAA